ncbi:MAG: vWA domain-containing protein [Elusimicrobiota bacterium]
MLRILIILFLTFAFSRPVFEGYRKEDDFVEFNVLLIDNSYSMSYKRGRQTALKKAKELAIKLTEKTEGEFAVGTVNDGLSNIDDFKSNKSKIRRDIEEVNVSYFNTDIIKSVNNTAEFARDRLPENSGYNIFLFSDFNKDGFTGSEFEYPAQLSDIKFMMVDVVDGNKNIFTGIPDTITGFTGIPVDLKTSVYSPHSTEGTLEVVINNNSINKSVFQINKNNSELLAKEEISFRNNFDRPGNYPAKFSLAGRRELDSIKMDNTAYFNAEIKPKIRALIVDGSPGYTIMDSESYFFTRALDPGNYSGPIKYRVVTHREFEDIDVMKYDQVFLLNTTLSENSYNKILDYSQRGGAVGIFAGENLNFTVYSELIKSLMPVNLLSDEPEILISENNEVRENKNLNIEATGKFKSIFKENRPNPGIAKVLRTQSMGDFKPALKIGEFPLLWMYTDTRSNTAFFTSAASARWGQLPLKAPYPAFINLLIKELAAGKNDREKGQYKVGDILDIDSDKTGRIKIQSEEPEDKIDMAREKLPLATVPGNYITEEKVIPVNLDLTSGESELKKMDEQKIKNLFEKGDRIFYIPYSEDIYKDIVRIITGEEKSFTFLMFAFALLIAEEILRKYLQTVQK